jgi:hypothetical protein
VRLIAFLLAASLYPATLHAQALPQAAVPATSASGSDIGDRINHVLKSCALQCTVYIPPGNYSFSVAIHLELNTFGTYKLSGDPGAVLNYTANNKNGIRLIPTVCTTTRPIRCGPTSKARAGR